MNDLDFLPADYVCVQTTRKNNNWLRGLFAAVLVLMAIGWGAQRASFIERSARRDRIKEQTALMLAHVPKSDSIRLQLKQTENDARLLEVLRLSAQPSQWLSAIVAALPDQAAVFEFRAELEDAAELAAQRPSNASPANPKEQAIPDPVEQDLDRLAKLLVRRSLVISLRGTAPDDLQVSQFLSALHRTNLFQRVQLLFTDQQTQGDRTTRLFAVRLQTAPFVVRNPAPNRDADDPVRRGAITSRVLAADHLAPF